MRVTIRDIGDLKRKGEKFAMMTAYDYTSSRILDEAGIPIILVGDSLGQIVLGYDTTVPVTMDEMIHHIKAVVRGSRSAHVVGDLPFLSYQADVSEAVRNAGRILKEGGAQSVKLEGGRQIVETVRRIVQSGIPVMGHIGLTPQAVNQLSGYHAQGRSTKAAIELIEDARALEEAGVYSIVVESVPTPLGGLISQRVSVPIIGIGAGVQCDGQVQVFHDVMGLFTDFVPRHTRRYLNLAENIKEATARYIADVKSQAMPSDEEGYSMKQSVLEELTGQPAESTGQPAELT